MLDLEQLPTPRLLSAQGFSEALASTTSAPEQRVLLEVGYQQLQHYQLAHIPGAYYFDTGLIEKPPSWQHIPDSQLVDVLTAFEIQQNSVVYLYGRKPLEPLRLAIILMYAGVEAVTVLDGGLAAWQGQGFALETGNVQPKPVQGFGTFLPAHAGLFADLEQVKQALKDPDNVVVSVRSWQEYCGKTSGYDFINPTGRIAGAVWGYGGSDSMSLEHFLNPDTTLKDLTEITEKWRKQGITADKRVIFYCGTNWRASAACFIASLAGWQNISVFDGGWLAWSADPHNPIAQGEP